MYKDGIKKFLFCTYTLIFNISLLLVSSCISDNPSIFILLFSRVHHLEIPK